METATVDRTAELELRLRAVRVNSEDTCAFWQQRDDTLIPLRRCHYCRYYAPTDKEIDRGLCEFKQTAAKAAGRTL